MNLTETASSQHREYPDTEKAKDEQEEKVTDRKDSGDKVTRWSWE